MGRQQGQLGGLSLHLPICCHQPSDITEKMALINSEHTEQHRTKEGEPNWRCKLYSLGKFPDCSESRLLWKTGTTFQTVPPHRVCNIRGLLGKHFAFFKMLHKFKWPLMAMPWDPSLEAALTC